MTGGVASLFKANGVEWVNGQRELHGPDDDRRRGRGGGHLRERDHRDRLVSRAPADPGHRLAALRRLDRAARADRGAAPARDPRRRDHRLRVRLDLQPVRLRGDDRRDAAEPHPAGGRGRGEGAREGVQEARDRAPPLEAVHAGRRSRRASDRALRRGRERRLRPDARLGGPRAARRRDRPRGGRGHVRPRRESPPTTTGARTCRTSTRPATSPATGSSRTPASGRARSRPRTRWVTTRPSAIPPSHARSTPIPRSRASG